MLRIAAGIVVGFIVWSLIWVGTDALLTAISPEGYGKYVTDLQTSAATNQPFQTRTTMSLFALTLSVVCSFISGYVAALVAGENKKSSLVLGFILLAVGLVVQISFWVYFPLWYHLTFLLSLIPATILGGSFRKSTVLT